LSKKNFFGPSTISSTFFLSELIKRSAGPFQSPTSSSRILLCVWLFDSLVSFNFQGVYRVNHGTRDCFCCVFHGVKLQLQLPHAVRLDPFLIGVKAVLQVYRAGNHVDPFRQEKSSAAWAHNVAPFLQRVNTAEVQRSRNVVFVLPGKIGFRQPEGLYTVYDVFSRDSLERAAGRFPPYGVFFKSSFVIKDSKEQMRKKFGGCNGRLVWFVDLFRKTSDICGFQSERLNPIRPSQVIIHDEPLLCEETVARKPQRIRFYADCVRLISVRQPRGISGHFEVLQIGSTVLHSTGRVVHVQPFQEGEFGFRSTESIAHDEPKRGTSLPDTHDVLRFTFLCNPFHSTSKQRTKEVKRRPALPAVNSCPFVFDSMCSSLEGEAGWRSSCLLGQVVCALASPRTVTTSEEIISADAQRLCIIFVWVGG
jgi:hypothetical protein